MYQSLIFQKSMNLLKVTFQGLFTKENWPSISKIRAYPKTNTQRIAIT